MKSLTTIILCFATFLINVDPSKAHDHTASAMMKYPGEYIKHLDIVVDTSKDGSVSIVKIGRWSPFRRYPWFRLGDTILEVEGKKASLSVLHSLIQNKQAWITFTREDYLNKVQINLSLNFFSYPPWAQDMIE